MQAEELIRSGDINAARLQLLAAVRAKPADAKLRTFLFQLFSVFGLWDRALTQLNVVGELDPMAAMMVGAYSQVLQSEALRTEVFAGRKSPVIIGEPEQWVALVLQALRLQAEIRPAQAAALREQAFDQAQTVSGTIDGVPFEWIADADPRLGPCLEIIVNGRYSWVPFSRLKELKFEAPADLRDSIWAPVEITWANGGQTVGFVPARYPGSEQSEDSAIALARKTEWVNAGDDFYVGYGQRMFATDAGEYPLLDTRLITFNPA